MPGSPSMHGITERQNKSLKDMIKSMISHFTLSKSLWREALKAIAYIFNKVPTKVAANTPYELWTSKKTSPKHFHIWGFSNEARPYRSNERKLDSITVSSYFIGYSEQSSGCQFYDLHT